MKTVFAYWINVQRGKRTLLSFRNTKLANESLPTIRRLVSCDFIGNFHVKQNIGYCKIRLFFSIIEPVIMKGVFPEKQYQFCGIFGGWIHNLQLTALLILSWLHRTSIQRDGAGSPRLVQINCLWVDHKQVKTYLQQCWWTWSSGWLHIVSLRVLHGIAVKMRCQWANLCRPGT